MLRDTMQNGIKRWGRRLGRLMAVFGFPIWMPLFLIWLALCEAGSFVKDLFDYIWTGR